MEQYNQQDQVSVERKRAQYPNKQSILLAMRLAKLNRITVTFDGYGDDGQLEEWEVEGADGTSMSGREQLPAVSVSRIAVSWNGEVESRIVPLHEAVEALCYDLLEDRRPGWEIEDGSFGGFVFDVTRQAIALEHHQRFTDSVLTTEEL